MGVKKEFAFTYALLKVIEEASQKLGLPLAIRAHQRNDLSVAASHYERALEQGIQEATLFQNYGALLRSQGQDEKALKILERGLDLHPRHAGILTNFANLKRKSNPATAIYLSLLALQFRIAEDSPLHKQKDLWMSLFAMLREQAQYSWALALVPYGFAALGNQPELLLQVLFLAEALKNDVQKSENFEPLVCEVNRKLEISLENCTPILQAEVRIGLAGHAFKQADIPKALGFYEHAMQTLQESPSSDQEEGDKRQNLIDVNSWNFGCTLIKQQQLARGWSLFEYGLRTPAPGKQRWQRSLRKPFSSNQLALWNGESLVGKKLLLLEEQAIGDVMMFLTLLPTLQKEADHIGIMLADRLLPIYKRSLAMHGLNDGSVAIWSYSDAKDGSLTCDSYDFQSPLGSICQHRFSDLQSYAPRTPILVAKKVRSDSLRKEYLDAFDKPVERLVGISWQGGGSANRIAEKSMKIEDFAKVIAPIEGVGFVSLQYGKKAAPDVKQWQEQNLDVIFDQRIDPLRQMDLWLAQVAACDAVVSVANTTIHGAGGLDLPTQCLLSRHSDWRWFDDPVVTRSLWYPSVGIARQSTSLSWQAAISKVRDWMMQGCPKPSGPLSSQC